MKRLVILGAGTAGTMMANKFAAVGGQFVRALPERAWQITLVDQDADHVYQPGLLFLPFGDYRRDEIVRPRQRFVPPGVTLNLAGIERVEPEARRVVLKGGDTLPYDVLVIATGTRVVPEETGGLTGQGWRTSAFDFYTLEGATALGEALERWPGGRLVVNVAEMPIKCPVAPLEFAFLADAYFTKRGMRDKVEIVYSTPLDGAFTKPKAAAKLGHLLTERKIDVVSEFALERVDGERRIMSSYDGREDSYDLLVTTPVHRGAAVLDGSGLVDGSGFVQTDRHTLQSKAFPNVFAIGDATDLPTSKAGSVAHFQSEVLLPNVLAFIDDKPLPASFDGHANCFVETGHGKALLLDFNYEVEPLPGRYPLPGVGPFTLLEESYVNHWGKLGFKWVYWNVLLRGKELPIDHSMVMAGKWS